MEGSTSFKVIGLALLALVLLSPLREVSGSDLCEEKDMEKRQSMCDSVFAASAPVRALYRSTKHQAGYVPDWMYDFADPKTVTLVSEFHTEILKYSAELFRLSQAVQDYQSTPDYLVEKQDDIFRRQVEKLHRLLNDADASVYALKDDVAKLVGVQPPATGDAIAKTTPTPTEKNIESVISIQRKAHHVTKFLKNLLRRWGYRCYSCGDSRKRRSAFMVLSQGEISDQ